MKTAVDFYKEHPEYLPLKEVSTKPVVDLLNWAFGISFGGYPIAYGDAIGHPKFPDGYPIRTSVIMKHEGDTVETLNTIYKLVGEPANHVS